MSKKLIIPGIALLCVALFIFFMIDGDGPQTMRVKRQNIVQAVYATGDVEPVTWARISPSMTGKVTQVLVVEREDVTQGQVLARLDSSVEQQVLGEYQAKLEFLEKEKRRYASLSERDHASASKFEQIVSDHAAAASRVQAQEKMIERMNITSPIDGLVLKKDIEPGEVATPTSEIFWVGKQTPLRITAEVDEEDIALIEPGQQALIKADAFPDDILRGRVQRITPKGDPLDKSFRIRISLPDQTKLMIGMTVEVNIITKEKSAALVVPQQSVMDDRVWVKRGGDFAPVDVTTGIIAEQGVEIIDGLSEGNEILLAPSERGIGHDDE